MSENESVKLVRFLGIEVSFHSPIFFYFILNENQRAN